MARNHFVAKPPFNRSVTLEQGVELLKVPLRMTSERYGVAAEVTATVDDLEKIAADDRAM